jgi:hypothetical protein
MEGDDDMTDVERRAADDDRDAWLDRCGTA